MGYISEAEYRKNIKNGAPSGVFLFVGTEDYLKAYAINETRKAVCPDEVFGAFNDVTIDFPDFSAELLARTLEAPPMMSDKKLTVLKSFNLKALKPSEAEAFCKLIEEYSGDEMNVLVVSFIPDGIDVGYLPKRPSALFKRLSAAATFVSFDASTPAKLSVWAARHFEANGVAVSDKTARLFVEYCGTDMYRLLGEISKLCSFVKANGRDRVVESDILKVSVPEMECDAFAMSTAVMNGRYADALRALEIMKARQVKPEYALAEIITLYTNLYLVKLLKEQGLGPVDIGKTVRQSPNNSPLHEFKVKLYISATERTSLASLKRCLDLCLDADLAMKTYGKRNYEQIEKLICSL